MKAKSKKVFSIIKHIILITICIIMIFPFYWMIATAFKDTYAVYEYPPKIFPNPLVVSNFGKVWELLPFGQAFVNSIKIVLTVVVIQLLTASMAAFAFAKLQFKFRELIFLLVLATMMIPEQVIMIPLFQMFQKVGLIDTHLGLILPTAFCYPCLNSCKAMIIQENTVLFAKQRKSDIRISSTKKQSREKKYPYVKAGKGSIAGAKNMA